MIKKYFIGIIILSLILLENINAQTFNIYSSKKGDIIYKYDDIKKSKRIEELVKLSTTVEQNINKIIDENDLMVNDIKKLKLYIDYLCREPGNNEGYSTYIRYYVSDNDFIFINRNKSSYGIANWPIKFKNFKSFMNKSCYEESVNKWRINANEYNKKIADILTFISDGAYDTQITNRILFLEKKMIEHNDINELSVPILRNQYVSLIDNFTRLTENSSSEFNFEYFISLDNSTYELIRNLKNYNSKDYSKGEIDEFKAAYYENRILKGSDIRLYYGFSNFGKSIINNKNLEPIKLFSTKINENIVVTDTNYVIIESDFKNIATKTRYKQKPDFNFEKSYSGHIEAFKEQYINSIRLKLIKKSYIKREKVLISSEFNKMKYLACIGSNKSYDLSDVLEKKLVCESLATQNEYEFKFVDNSYLIPEKKWYKIYLKNDEVYVENWGYLKDELIYDDEIGSFKIRNLDNSSLTLESNSEWYINRPKNRVEYLDDKLKFCRYCERVIDGTERYIIEISDGFHIVD